MITLKQEVNKQRVLKGRVFLSRFVVQFDFSLIWIQNEAILTDIFFFFFSDLS